MRLPLVFLLLLAFFFQSGCGVSLSSQKAPTSWTTGFWLWGGGSTDDIWPGQPLDVLFVHAGTIESPGFPAPAVSGAGEVWHASGRLPDQLPPAREYWLVFRCERQQVPPLRMAAKVAQEVSRLQTGARKRGLHVVGLQLDVDSPTGALAEYARLLREVRKELPPGLEISITALLDWFRNGTAIDELIAETDEFVPQFYDLSDPKSRRTGTAIAARIDAARWGPAFNRFGKRFRVGISTFGRARVVRRDAPSGPGYLRAAFFGDLAPIDVAANAAFRLQAERSQANELVLTYRATRKTRLGYTDFDPGDAVQFILSTPEAIRTAVDSARRMGGLVAGVVFFRWAGSQEPLVMQPDEVLTAASRPIQGGQRRHRIEVIDGHCAAVECVDVYLGAADAFSPRPLRYRIRTSAELEYFLPEPGVPVRMAGPSELALSLPPYCARGRLYLGRAVTDRHSEYTVEEEQ